jgi:hypothetical protein
MANTRGGLTPASLTDLSSSPHGFGSVEFMFNPHQYSLTLQHTFNPTGMGGNAPKVEITKVGQQKVTLKDLIFDAYEVQGGDIKTEMTHLLQLMEPVRVGDSNNPAKHDARKIGFAWGSFAFVCYIESITQNLILFTQAGVPVRAKVDITLIEYGIGSLPLQNPTSGGGPIERVWRVTAGDRLDTIAAEVYKDATKWRLIARHNGIVNPFALRAGLELGIPPVE